MKAGKILPELAPADAPGHSKHGAAATRRTLLTRLSGSVVTLAVASACRAGGPAPEGARPAPAFDKEVEIRWTTWGNETHPMVKASTLGVEAFSKHFPKIKVRNLPDPGCAAVTTQFAAGDGPDVAGQCCTCLPEWARAGVTENLDPYIKRDWKKEQIADFAELQYNWFNGQHFNQPELGQYAVPMYMGTIALYYNTARFREAGVPFPDETWDWDKYRETMLRLTNPAKNQFGGYMVFGWDRRQQLVNQNGGNMVDPKDDLKAVVDQPKTVEAFQWIYERMWRDHSAPRYAADGDERPQPVNIFQMIGSGFVAMMQEGSWILARMTPAALGTEEEVWNVAPLPKGPTGLRATLATTDGWIIWNGSKNKDAAWELVKFLQTDEWWEINIPITGQQPTRKSLQDRWADLLKKGQSFLANINLRPFTDAVKQNYARPVELFRFHTQVAPIVEQYYNASVRDNKQGVREAMVKAAAEANEQLRILAQQAGIKR